MYKSALWGVRIDLYIQSHSKKGMREEKSFYSFFLELKPLTRSRYGKILLGYLAVHWSVNDWAYNCPIVKLPLPVSELVQ